MLTVSPYNLVVMYNVESFLSFCIAVMMSIPATASVSEGDGAVEICAMLAAVNTTERNVMATLTTDTGTGRFYDVGVSLILA